MHAFVRLTDRRTAFSSLNRVCIPCSAVITLETNLGAILVNYMFAEKCQALYSTHHHRTSESMRLWWAFVADIHSIPRLHSVQAKPVWPQHLVDVWRQFQLPMESVGIPCKERWIARTAARSQSCTWSGNSGLRFRRNITTDNFFTLHALAKFLLRQNLTLLGTVRKTRKELPGEFVLKERTASVFAFTEDTTHTETNKWIWPWAFLPNMLG